MTIEQRYTEISELSHRKKYAQFFTPNPIADFMARWVLGCCSGPADILEPAFGLGIFSRCLLKINQNINISGYEIDPEILNIVKVQLPSLCSKTAINNQDYITAPWENKYDGIICNPPYLKFHDYDNDKLVPIVNKQLRTNLNKFTNLYPLFLMKSLSQLKEGGRCAYIIPSEFLNSDYGVEVKRYLLSLNIRLHFIIVNFEENVFDGAITTACIVLCENTDSDGVVRFSSIDKISDLGNTLDVYSEINIREINPETKWKNYYGSSNAKKYKNLIDFSNYAKVSRGIATGANKYFSLNSDRAKELQIPQKALLKCICHCTDINKTVFTTTDFDNLTQSGKNIFLFKGLGNENNPHVLEYIHHGENEGINGKYLCEKRKPWYSIERREPAPIWVSVFNRSGLKFVRNEANVSNLTTFHCMYVTNMFVDIDILFAYLLTDTASQIFLDNSRQYGNGLIKFEPNDLNKSKVVDFEMLSDQNISEIKSLYSSFKESEDQQIIDKINNIFVSVYAS